MKKCEKMKIKNYILLYTTINQMRPVEIIEAIHEHILNSRERQLKMIRRTRRAPVFEGKFTEQIKCRQHGYITRIDVEKIGAAIKNANAETEVVLKISIGSFVAFQDPLAEVKTINQTTAEIIGKAVLNALLIDRQRDISIDTAYGIEQLEMIAWTSISTAKSNPAPGRLTIRSLRDVLARWSFDKDDDGEDGENGEEIFPVVYRDNTPEKLLDAFETFAVVSSESMQYQTYIEVVLALTATFERLPVEWQTRSEDLILRILSVLGDHALTAELDKTLSGLVEKLKSAGRGETAFAVEAARQKMRLSIGKLNSRSTRAAAE